MLLTSLAKCLSNCNKIVAKDCFPTEAGTSYSITQTMQKYAKNNSL